MIAAWMFYSLVTGLLLFLGAVAADRVGRSIGVATRFIWLGAIASTLALSAGALARRSALAVARAQAVPVDVVRSGAASEPSVSETRTSPAPSPHISSLEAFPRRVRGAIDDIRAMPLARFDRPLAAAAGASAMLAVLGLMIILFRLRRLEARLRRATVDGQPVLISPRMGPALVGVLAPRIVIPEWALALAPRDRRLILDHERGHAQAYDPLLLFASTLLTALQPWNPALWLLRARIHLAIETDCDRRLLRANPDVRRYAELLLTVNQHTGMPAPSLAFAERPTNVERRIRAMLEARAARPARVILVAGALAIGLSVAAWKLPVPSRSATPQLPSTTSTSSITGGGPCVDGSRSGFAEMNDLRRIARARHPAILNGGTPVDSTIGFVIDETCAIRRDTAIVLRASHWNQDTVIQAAFPDVRRRPGERFGLLSAATRSGASRPPLLFYVVQPTPAWTARRSRDACGFGTRADERCGELGTVVLRRLDSVRLIIAVRARPGFDEKAPVVDHYFLVTSQRPLPATLPRRIPFARVSYQNNAVEIENRVTTDPYLVFGSLFEPPGRWANPAHAPPPPRITFDSVVGIAHYLQPTIKLEEIDRIRPATTCDGPVGACYEVNGKKINFPG